MDTDLDDGAAAFLNDLLGTITPNTRGIFITFNPAPTVDNPNAGALRYMFMHSNAMQTLGMLADMIHRICRGDA